MIKLKRKLAGRSEFESFEHYIDFLRERITFQDATNESQIQLDTDLHTELRTYYKKYESYFALIEPLTYLQLLLQPLIERLILYDRVAFLDEATNKENGTDRANKLVKIKLNILQRQRMSQFNLKTLKLEGQLSKFTNIVTGYKYRYFVVDNDLARLDYFMSEEMKHQKPRGSIELENAVISPSEEDSTTFLIHTIDNELFKLRALDAKERQHWVNVLRFVSQSFKNSDSPDPNGDSTQVRRSSKSQAQVIQNEKCTFELVKEVLSQVKFKQNALDQFINNLPLKSSRLARHDKDILMLKATARACTNCISESCNIIKSIQNKKLISSTSRAIGLKKQMQHIEKKTDIKQNINVYNGTKSDYVHNILPKSSDRTLSMSLPPSSESVARTRAKTLSQSNTKRPESSSSDLASEPVLRDSSNNDSS